MIKQQLLDELRRMTPAECRKVLAMAQTIRAARAAGDMRPAQAIVAPFLARAHKTVH